MNRLGMDVEAVRALAAQLGEARQEIAQLGDELTAQLEGVDWTGPDATGFRSSWQGELKPLIDELALAVGRLGEDAAAQAAQQASTSSQ